MNWIPDFLQPLASIEPYVLKNRLIFSFFALLIFCLVLYFWIISRSKIKANHRDGSGLVYMAFAFLLHAIIGIASIYVPLDDKAPFFILSGLISFCFLTSLSFFSVGTHAVDKLVSGNSWKNGIKYAGFAWTIGVAFGANSSVTLYLDAALSVIALAALGFFVVRYFIKRELRFLALISVAFFGAYILLQIFQPGLEGGKFLHISTLMLGPSMALAVIVLSYTFSWINELNFYELSNIWISPGEDNAGSEKEVYARLTQSSNRETWLSRIANDEIEEVIEEMIILKKHKNANLELILNLASRNIRNNNNSMKGIITYEDYQLNRNRISITLTEMIQEGE